MGITDGVALTSLCVGALTCINGLFQAALMRFKLQTYSLQESCESKAKIELGSGAAIAGLVTLLL